MLKRLFIINSVVAILFTYGCVKETYDMNKLSDKVTLSPTLAVAAVKGDVSLSDIVDSGDTVVYDQDKFVRLIFKRDSAIDLKLSDFFDWSNMISYTKSYPIGIMNISSFTKSVTITLDQISQKFSTSLRNQLVSYNNTNTHNFPPFPSTTLNETAFPSITNIDHAVFSSGYIDISVTNNLPAVLNGLTIQLYNSSGHTAIGGTKTISAIQPGQTGTTSIDLTNVTVTGSIVAAITLNGSPGTSTPVYINLSTNGIDAKIVGRDLKVKSGRVILPTNSLTTGTETMSFNPGSGVEVDSVKITTGNLSYQIQKPSGLTASVTVTLPTAKKSGSILSNVINLSSGTTVTGNISVSNTVIDLGTITSQPYNTVPYTIIISSSGLIDFNSTDQLSFNFKLQNPTIDFAKGYFGKQIQSFDPDSIDLDMDDVLAHVTGDFIVANPSIKVNYLNSFAVPFKLKFNATGKKETKTIDLGLDSITLSYPNAPVQRDVSSSFSVSKSNSHLPEIISMPPEKIRFSGGAIMNSSGIVNRNNYVFGNSRFIGNVEVELPLEFRFRNLTFADTVKNFLKDDDGGDFTPEDFKNLKMIFNANNGFPVGISFKMDLYDSVSRTIKSTIDGSDILKPAPIDNTGKANGSTPTTTTLVFNEAFFNAIKSADKVIFRFVINTTNSDTKDIKIYSDYRISFNATILTTPEINLN
jgi:hypothetical protein